jgi:hypothetical protein
LMSRKPARFASVRAEWVWAPGFGPSVTYVNDGLSTSRHSYRCSVGHTHMPSISLRGQRQRSG